MPHRVTPGPLPGQPPGHLIHTFPSQSLASSLCHVQLLFNQREHPRVQILVQHLCHATLGPQGPCSQSPLSFYISYSFCLVTAHAGALASTKMSELPEAFPNLSPGSQMLCAQSFPAHQLLTWASS
jgi:hypothetical protein